MQNLHNITFSGLTSLNTLILIQVITKYKTKYLWKIVSHKIPKSICCLQFAISQPDRALSRKILLDFLLRNGNHTCTLHSFHKIHKTVDIVIRFFQVMGCSSPYFGLLAGDLIYFHPTFIG
jgi:hypothetical protein